MENDELLLAFFQVNVTRGNFKPYEFEMYLSHVIKFGIAVIAQTQNGRLNPNDLLEKNFIGITEDKMHGLN